mmetsp:Transcript_13526/g.25465  ORF Transcript_13526/g.25465 Transcript_13526/m.25465 type:complete len:190 (-) Transcript_13526:61-630(-)
MVTWHKQDGQLELPFLSWKFDSPINKNLKSNQIYNDSPASLPQSLTGIRQRLPFDVPTRSLRSNSETPRLPHGKKSFAKAIRSAFLNSLTIKTQTPSALADYTFDLPEVNRSVSGAAHQSRRYTKAPFNPSEKRESSRFKPYSLHDYRNLALPKTGGLGSQVGSADWKARRAKIERIKTYNVQLNLSRG